MKTDVGHLKHILKIDLQMMDFELNPILNLSLTIQYSLFFKGYVNQNNCFGFCMHLPILAQFTQETGSRLLQKIC